MINQQVYRPFSKKKGETEINENLSQNELILNSKIRQTERNINVKSFEYFSDRFLFFFFASKNEWKEHKQQQKINKTIKYTISWLKFYSQNEEIELIVCWTNNIRPKNQRPQFCKLNIFLFCFFFTLGISVCSSGFVVVVVFF